MERDLLKLTELRSNPIICVILYTAGSSKCLKAKSHDKERNVEDEKKKLQNCCKALL